MILALHLSKISSAPLNCGITVNSLGSRCSSVVELTDHEQEVGGLNLRGCLDSKVHHGSAALMIIRVSFIRTK